jgi:beta-glucosidase-like glycosyl hydrolase
VNIFRDPRWGRGQETPGEDPKINGDYAVAYVSGLQGSDKTYLKTSACLKHYAAYSEESGRNSFPAVVTKQDMEDTYLPAFEAGVTRGGASSIMCSYNAETYGYGIYGNGTQDGAIPSCANKGILNDLARDKWGFDGYITSDCGAVGNVQNQHHYTKTPDETARATLTAGMDTDCGNFLTEQVMTPLINDKSTGGSNLVDTALKNLFRVQFRLGFADPPALVPWSNYGTGQVDTQAHRDLAREAADQSLVLLKNDGSLPLTHDLRAAPVPAFQILVAGRNAKATKNMQGNYYGDAPFLRSPVDGLSNYGDITFHDGKDVDAVVKDVEHADYVVLVVGLTSEGVQHNDEAEGKDRSSLRLPTTDGDQEALIEQVAAAAGGKPVVLVVMSGGPVDISAAKENPGIIAIIWCGYPGQSGGDAIADAIFGVTNRFGKLTQTWYPESFVSQVDLKDMGMRPNAETGNPGRSYRFYNGSTVFSFGDGLSYTTLEHSVSMTHFLSAADIDEDLLRKPLHKDARVVARAQVDVRNTGGRDGDAVVMLFVAPPADLQNSGAPSKSLVGFDRVSIASGGSHTMSFDLTSLDLSFAGEDGERLSAEGNWRVFVGGESGGEPGFVNLRRDATRAAFV